MNSVCWQKIQKKQWQWYENDNDDKNDTVKYYYQKRKEIIKIRSTCSTDVWSYSRSKGSKPNSRINSKN